MKKRQTKNFWDYKINPITGWKVEDSERIIYDRRTKEEQRITKSLKSYGKNN
jgi:hypothetical protein